MRNNLAIFGLLGVIAALSWQRDKQEPTTPVVPITTPVVDTPPIGSDEPIEEPQAIEEEPIIEAEVQYTPRSTGHYEYRRVRGRLFRQKVWVR